MSSIRQRTLGLALLVFGISMLVIGFISYRYAAHEIEALYDASLEQNARLLESLLQALQALIVTWQETEKIANWAFSYGTPISCCCVPLMRRSRPWWNTRLDSLASRSIIINGAFTYLK